MKRVAIILARGGSKRLPRKNIRPFHGQPILAYPAAAAWASKLFDDVFVSTDDDEIAEFAIYRAYCQVIRRPAELANDTATTAAAMHHAVQFLLDEGAALEYACCMYPCTPLIEPSDLHEGFNRLAGSDLAYCFTTTRYQQHPVRALIPWDDGRVQSVHPQFDDVRNQDLDHRVHDAGQWYFGRTAAWINEVPIFGTRSLGYELPRWRAIDIDTLDDWRVAEAAYAAQHTPRGE